MARKQVTFYMDLEDFEKFCSLYPEITPVFLRRCVYRAIENPKWFEEVFWNTSEKVLRDR